MQRYAKNITKIYYGSYTDARLYDPKPLSNKGREVNDIYHAVHQGANALMLTGETAHGRYPVEAMKMLVETANGSLEEL